MRQINEPVVDYIIRIEAELERARCDLTNTRCSLNSVELAAEDLRVSLERAHRATQDQVEICAAKQRLVETWRNAANKAEKQIATVRNSYTRATEEKEEWYQACQVQRRAREDLQVTHDQLKDDAARFATRPLKSWYDEACKERDDARRSGGGNFWCNQAMDARRERDQFKQVLGTAHSERDVAIRDRDSANTTALEMGKARDREAKAHDLTAQRLVNTKHNLNAATFRRVQKERDAAYDAGRAQKARATQTGSFDALRGELDVAQTEVVRLAKRVNVIERERDQLDRDYKAAADKARVLETENARWFTTHTDIKRDLCGHMTHTRTQRCEGARPDAGPGWVSIGYEVTAAKAHHEEIAKPDEVAALMTKIMRDETAYNEDRVCAADTLLALIDPSETE